MEAVKEVLSGGTDIGGMTAGDGREGEKAKAPDPDRHPWLIGATWFVDAVDRLTAVMAPRSAVVIGLDSQRDRDPTYGVHVESLHTEDELDEMPGLRRIERRAGELARHMPARPPFGARITATATEMVVHLRWHHHGHAVLMSRLLDDGWHSADMIVLPERVLRITDDALIERSPHIIHAMDRILGGGVLDPGAFIHSASRRGDQIRLVLKAGGIHHMGSSEVA